MIGISTVKEGQPDKLKVISTLLLRENVDVNKIPRISLSGANINSQIITNES